MNPTVTGKTAELREMTLDELRRKVEERRRELLGFRIQRANQQLKNPLKLRDLRREVARILSIIREKENEARKS